MLKTIWERTWTDPTAFFTFWLAIFTFVLAASTIGLWIASIRALRHGRQTAERQLRAYVFADKARITDVEVGKQPKVKVQFLNSGRTPAYHLTANLSMAFGPRSVPEQEFTKVPKPSRVSRMTLGPNQKLRAQFVRDSSLSPDEMIAIQRGSHVLYVVGTVDYIDAFNNGRPGKFRLMYSNESIARGDGRPDVCEQGNEYK